MHLRGLFLFLVSILLLATVVMAQKKPKKAAESGKNVKEKKEVVIMETNMGKIELRMWRSVAPKTVENFIQLAKRGYYNGVTFHRVIDNFMIQGGDPTGTGSGGESIYGRTFQDEVTPKVVFDRAGLIAMANAGPNTNGSQFFITLVPTPHLNGHHTIFGEVAAGMDVVKAIGKVKTGQQDKPVKPVVMQKVYPKK